MDVTAWLKELGFGEHAETFAANGVGAGLLGDLTSEDLKELGLVRMADRKRLLKAITDLAPADEAGGARPRQPSSESEHRQVAVLFADLAGYTRLTSTLGSERTGVLLNRYFQVVDAIVEGYGGTVDKHIGDNVMAVFGAPVAHDDDYLRAARTALDIHQRLAALSVETDCLLQAHIGIASGRVLAGGIGSDIHRQYTVTGDAVNLAARLQHRANSGETLISQALYEGIAAKAACQPIGELTLKGIDRPVGAWRLEKLRDGRDAPPGTPFVGRQAELSQFAAAANRCAASGKGQVLVVRGEAGIGKTRLVDEFESIAAGAGFLSHRALVLDFGVGERQDAVRMIVRSLLGIPPGAAKTERRKAAVEAVAVGMVASTRKGVLDDLLDLTSTKQDHAIYDAMDNAARIAGQHAVIAGLVRATSAAGPRLLVVEDVHWSTPLVLSHLAAMAAAVADCPALLVMTSRIDGFPLDQAWRFAAANCPLMTFDLGALPDDDAAELATTVLGRSNPFASDCIRRAQGNPLFLEQLLRHAEDQPGTEIPASIQSLVLARADRLSPADKTALQAASVLGQRFSLDVLRELAGDADLDCSELVRRQLVRPEGDGFLFAHALVQAGIYASLPTPRRNRLHRLAAEWYAGRDFILCAEHLDRASDPGAAAAYYAAAIEQAAALRFATVLRLVDRGIALAGDPGVTCDLMCLRGDALRDTGATQASIDAFRSALQASTDDLRQCRAWIGLAGGLRIADRHTAALDILDKAGALATGQGLVAEQAEIHYLRGNVCFPLGNIDGCLVEHTRALELSREVGSTRGEAQALSGLGDAFYLRGQMRSACDRFRSCVAVCREHGYGRIEVANGHMIGWSRIHLMEFQDAHADALQAISLAAEVSHHRAQILGLMLAGRVELEMTLSAEAADHFRQGLCLARRIGASNFEAHLLLLQGQLEALGDRPREARLLADQAVAIVRSVGMAFIGPTVLALQASLCDGASDRQDALTEAERILDAGCVGHNHIWFAEIAMDDALARGAFDDVHRHADRLAAYTQAQPLAWSDFLIARARAIAAWDGGDRSSQLAGELRRLHGLATTSRARSKGRRLAAALAAA